MLAAFAEVEVVTEKSHSCGWEPWNLMSLSNCLMWPHMYSRILNKARKHSRLLCQPSQLAFPSQTLAPSVNPPGQASPHESELLNSTKDGPPEQVESSLETLSDLGDQEQVLPSGAA